MKTLKQFVEGTGYLKVKSPDEQRFVDKHKTETIPDANGNGDEVFKASNVKKIPRKAERKGYEPGEDEKVYEEVEQVDELSVVGLDKYHKKAYQSMFDKDSDKKTVAKRKKGMDMAYNKAGFGKAKVYASEEADLDEKKLTPAEMKKREEVAKAIQRDNPKMPMSKKMAIATATAKKVAEQQEFVQSIDALPPRLQEEMLLVHSRLSEENQDKFIAACQTEDGLEKMIAFTLENRGK